MKANITYKSVLSKYKNIKERNKAFNNLDPQSQRLEIAWDALNLVLNQKLNASWGGYWSNRLFGMTRNLGSKELQEFVLEEENFKDCEVCQRGLLMISQIRLGNTLNSIGYSYSAYACGSEKSIKGFSLVDFIKIEAEYERNCYETPFEVNTNQKLANICCNILVNGNFNPEDKTNYLKWE